MNFWQIFALCYASIGLGLILGSTLKKCDKDSINTPLIAGIANLILGIGIFAYIMYKNRSNYNLNTY